MYENINGKRWPIYITGEDIISIKVLLDYDSPEWRWLRLIYDQLNDAVVRDGARFVILLFPLAYQLEKDYPYIPQKLLRQYFAENSILFLDILPALRQYESQEVFLLDRVNFYDIWHLTEKGHRLVAQELENYLITHGLLEY